MCAVQDGGKVDLYTVFRYHGGMRPCLLTLLCFACATGPTQPAQTKIVTPPASADGEPKKSAPREPAETKREKDKHGIDMPDKAKVALCEQQREQSNSNATDDRTRSAQVRLSLGQCYLRAGALGAGIVILQQIERNLSATRDQKFAAAILVARTLEYVSQFVPKQRESAARAYRLAARHAPDSVAARRWDQRGQCLQKIAPGKDCERIDQSFARTHPRTWKF